jgi:beta-N-acetylhexosaminidase
VNFPNETHIKIILVSFIVFSFFSCKKNNEEKIFEMSNDFILRDEIDIEEDISSKKEKELKCAIDTYMKNLSLDERIAQLFAVGIDGNDILHSYAKTEFKNGAPGSFLLFSANIAQTAEQTASFTNSVLSWFIEQNLVPPFFMIDNEGGDVYRFEEIGSKLLSPEKMTEYFLPDEAEQYYSLIALQMKAMNIHLNLAPIVEVKNEYNAAFLGRRSYGTMENVEKYGAAFIKGLDSAGVGATLKHFPGNTNADPHLGLPHLKDSQEEIELLYIEPFRKLSVFGADAVLISHIVIDSIDEGVPVCFSPKIINEKLKESFWKNGLVISDDLYMGALSKNGYPPEVAVVKALKAGIDILMISEKRFSKAAAAIKKEAQTDENFMSRINNAVRQILLFKIKRNILKVLPLEENSDYTLVPAQIDSVEENMLIFKNAKTKADLLYAEQINKHR